MSGAPWEINLRDVLRWCDLSLFLAEGDTASPLDPTTAIDTLFVHRLRTCADRKRAASLCQTHFGTAYEESVVLRHEISISDTTLSVNGVCLDRRPETGGKGSKESDMVVPASSLPALSSIIRGVGIGAPILLVGPPSCGKTSLVQAVADVCRIPLQRLSLSAVSDTSDLLGSYEQRVAEGDGEGKESGSRFVWVDGVVTQSVARGDWLLIEGANLAPVAVMDRLNRLLERAGPSAGDLLLPEQGATSDGHVRTVKRHPSFRIFMEYDEGYGDVSRALRNRCVELYLGPIRERELAPLPSNDPDHLVSADRPEDEPLFVVETESYLSCSPVHEYTRLPLLIQHGAVSKRGFGKTKGKKAKRGAKSSKIKASALQDALDIDAGTQGDSLTQACVISAVQPVLKAKLGYSTADTLFRLLGKDHRQMPERTPSDKETFLRSVYTPTFCALSTEERLDARSLSNCLIADACAASTESEESGSDSGSRLGGVLSAWWMALANGSSDTLELSTSLDALCLSNPEAGSVLARSNTATTLHRLASALVAHVHHTRQVGRMDVSVLLVLHAVLTAIECDTIGVTPSALVASVISACVRHILSSESDTLEKGEDGESVLVHSMMETLTTYQELPTPLSLSYSSVQSVMGALRGETETVSLFAKRRNTLRLNSLSVYPKAQREMLTSAERPTVLDYMMSCLKALSPCAPSATGLCASSEEHTPTGVDFIVSLSQVVSSLFRTVDTDKPVDTLVVKREGDDEAEEEDQKAKVFVPQALPIPASALFASSETLFLLLRKASACVSGPIFRLKGELDTLSDTIDRVKAILAMQERWDGGAEQLASLAHVLSLVSGTEPADDTPPVRDTARQYLSTLRPLRPRHRATEAVPPVSTPLAFLASLQAAAPLPPALSCAASAVFSHMEAEGVGGSGSEGDLCTVSAVWYLMGAALALSLNPSGAPDPVREQATNSARYTLSRALIGQAWQQGRVEVMRKTGILVPPVSSITPSASASEGVSGYISSVSPALSCLNTALCNIDREEKGERESRPVQTEDEHKLVRPDGDELYVRISTGFARLGLCSSEEGLASLFTTIYRVGTKEGETQEERERALTSCVELILSNYIGIDRFIKDIQQPSMLDHYPDVVLPLCVALRTLQTGLGLALLMLNNRRQIHAANIATVNKRVMGVHYSESASGSTGPVRPLYNLL
ncbi:midasin [Kipferlia bialata]|uniref:Midasin n=1 Tax=Kipferlia bialata TaxID=797122 RepID=A0A9K3GDU7_9EUKA|nr:midasin [Kipferlia bialata]|eukprot:g948.t1